MLPALLLLAAGDERPAGDFLPVTEAPGALRRLLEFYHFVAREFLIKELLIHPECVLSTGP